MSLMEIFLNRSHKCELIGDLLKISYAYMSSLEIFVK